MSMSNVHYPAIDAKRVELGVSKAAMAKKLELSWEGLDAKLAGEREFTLTEILTLAEWWGLCADELVGRSVPGCPVLRPVFRRDVIVPL